jgi:DNA-binding beta-propeller fold protein YncE
VLLEVTRYAIEGPNPLSEQETQAILAPHLGTHRSLNTIEAAAVALGRTQGFVHEPPAKQYSSATESLRFGTHGPADFYATDVAIGQDGKVTVIGLVRRRLRRYSDDGTLELEYPQLVGQPRRLAVAGNGQAYVSEAPLNKIHIYDAAGIELEVWDLTTKFGYGIGTGGIEFVAPDRLLIAASSDTILVVSLEGELIFQFGSQGVEPGQFSSIFDVAPASDGSYFVVDRTHRLHKFDAAGTFLWSRGGYGTDPGLFDVPVAVSVAPSGNVYVSDRRNYRVQKFDQMNFLLAWGGKDRARGA